MGQGFSGLHRRERCEGSEDMRYMILVLIPLFLGSCGSKSSSDPPNLIQVVWQGTDPFCVSLSTVNSVGPADENEMNGCAWNNESGLYRITFDGMRTGTWNGGAERTSDDYFISLSVILTLDVEVRTVDFTLGTPGSDSGDGGTANRNDGSASSEQLVSLGTTYMRAGDTMDLEGLLKYQDSSGQHAISAGDLDVQVLSGDSVTIADNSNGKPLQLDASRIYNGLTQIVWTWTKGTLDPTDDQSRIENIWVLGASPDAGIPDAGYTD